MICLRRSRLKTDIQANFHGEKKRLFEMELLINQRRIKRGEIQKHTFNSNHWKPAKKQLFVETGDKCAYCETPTSVVSFGDVEHYRPKSIYWWLAYCYDNFLVACQICNQRFKKDLFPIQNQRMQSPIITCHTTNGLIMVQSGTIAPDPLNQVEVDKFIYLHQQERPLLLNPYLDDPSDYFAWRADDVLREIEVTPNSENLHVSVIVNTENPEVESIALASIEYYGLNRMELRTERYKVYQNYRVFKATLEDDRISPGTRSLNRNIIEEMKAPGAQYAGMIRYFDALFSAEH